MKFSIIIATSQKRTDWLINRSLGSVYKQLGIEKSEWCVFIIDDNENESEFSKIKKRIELLRSKLKLKASDFPTTVLKNTRTRYMSGTGAWNTGIFEAHRQFPEGFVSILDDDDEYLPNHLTDCVTAISENTVAVFQRLMWRNADKSNMNVDLTKDQLTAENFFIGNPGVQGSNMFFKTQSLVDIGGFDETLPNTTDRDLMIRFLWKNDLKNIEVIETIGVIHYNHKLKKVNNDIPKKQMGLDLFYKKYKLYFSEESYKKSLARAKAFFNYNPKEQIVICMPLKNAEKTLEKAVYSVFQQKNTRREIVLLIGNDNSTDNSESILKEIATRNPNVVLLNVDFGNAYLNRNYLNEYARNNFPNCVLIGRLDADDFIYSENTISEIETLYDENNFDVLICGNKQVKNGEVQEWENKPSKKLLEDDFLLNQLLEMSNGNPKAELPSCNTFIKPYVKINYPDKPSAEDHWFTVLLLLQKDKLNILIDENLIYCYYSLDGFATHNNKKTKNYSKSRSELCNFYREYMSRRNYGIGILNKTFPSKTYRFLGEGKSSVVFTDETLVYKVFLLENYEALGYKRNILSTIQANKSKFDNSDFFYSIQQIIEVSKDCFVLIYPFEISEPCTSFEQDEIQNFLVECWQKRLIFQDVKPENFIRVNGQLKWIDYEPDKYTDNLFLNMAVRAFIYVKYSSESQTFLNKLCRSAINNFDLLELQGFQEFSNNLFAKIIYQESKIETPVAENYISINDVSEIVNEGIFKLPYKDNFNAEQVFWQLNKRNLYLEKASFENTRIDSQNYFSPKNIILKTHQIIKPKQNVSLIIKACVQDSEIIYEAVKHIVRQLSFPNVFDETILALDVRQSDFLREYNPNNTWEKLIEQSQKLVDDFIIDKFIFPKESDFQSINQKWFGIETKATHTIKKVPVTAQLYAFDKAKNDFILQVDCDVMIGRLSKEHSFLNDMILEIEKNENVLSVGFNIYKGQENSFTTYFGFENGGFVPEVRFCLLKKSRIYKVLPLKNEIVENDLKFSWYRALEQRQKETNTCSIRGGDSRSFFIHPQNFKKTDKDVWFTTLGRVEQLEIPECQINEFDLAGSYYDWTIPKRNEKLVIISCFRNIPLSRFLRFWYSLTSQSYQDWGLVLIDDASDNGISHFIIELIKPFKNRITFIQNRFQVGVAQNTYKAIHYFSENQESVVCIVDADDALIGRNVLKNIFEKYSFFGADVVIGKMYRTDKIHAHYKYTPNFINPRLYGGNVWQHIRSFKKYLFDSLSFNDLKIANKIQQTDDILLAKRFSQKMVFPEHCWDFTYMIPIVEMSENPMWINHFNIFHDRTTTNTAKIKKRKEEIISEILAKPSKSKQDVFKGRKTFLPNLNQIEIDITYECNLKCINCNRSSTQAPIKEGMSVEQIENFVRESIDINKKWKLINLLGGEPTIHKDFLQIVNLILNEYIVKHSPETILQVTSNGFGELVQERLSKLPKHKNLIIDYASFKDERIIPYFSPFNDAPIDKSDGSEKEYHKGCWVTSYCGIGLNQLGYYPCGVAGGIDRVFELNLGVQSLKNVDESIAKYLDTFCRFCGNFSDYEKNFGDFIPRNEKAALTKPVISESWKKVYKKYNGK
jgi:glycosyltransferase involved in cell wall biosynthesis